MAQAKFVEDLDRHTTHVCRVIEAHGGEIDKLIGDKTLAYFSHQDLGATEAVQSALECVEELELARRENRLPFSIAVGINTGTVIKGLLGSGDTRDYTTIGDPVNVAARAESIAETLSDPKLVLTENTLSQCNISIRVKTLEITKVKGKQKQVMLSQFFPGPPGIPNIDECRLDPPAC